jgi:hypothetical protein
MFSLAAVLVLLSAGMYAPTEVPAAAAPARGTLLRYDRPLGQIAQYHITLDVQGVEVSLDERLPVKWRAKVQISEEVIARAADGSIWLRVTSRPIDVTAGNGVFANGAAIEWPATQLHVSPRGEVLEIAQPATPGDPRARERTFAQLMTQSSPVVLPEGPVEPRDEWQVETKGARQTNRLLSVNGSGDGALARIASAITLPLALDETIDELGLMTHLAGESRQTSELELLLSSGLVRRHKGRSHIVTRSQTTLSLPDGPQVFEMESDLMMSFDIRLVAVDGRPVGSS